MFEGGPADGPRGRAPDLDHWGGGTRPELGVAYKAGDFDEAVLFFGLAAAQGCTKAEVLLGFCLELGLGVPTKDLDEAKRLYARAAAKGFEQAKDRLANLE